MKNEATGIIYNELTKYFDVTNQTTGNIHGESVAFSEIYLKDTSAPYWSDKIYASNWGEDIIADAFMDFPKIKGLVDLKKWEKMGAIAECFYQFKKDSIK